MSFSAHAKEEEEDKEDSIDIEDLAEEKGTNALKVFQESEEEQALRAKALEVSQMEKVPIKVHGLWESDEDDVKMTPDREK